MSITARLGEIDRISEDAERDLTDEQKLKYQNHAGLAICDEAGLASTTAALWLIALLFIPLYIVQSGAQ